MAGGIRAVRRNGRKRRKFRPRKFFKRLLVLTILFGIGYGFFWLGRGAFRLVANWRNRPAYLSIVQAEQVDDMPGIAAEAILIRQEVVVLADKPGQANLLLEPGERVESGHVVMEVIDKDLLAQIDAEVQKLEKGEQQGTAHQQNLAAVTDKLVAAQNDFKDALASYQQALRAQAVEKYKTLYNDLTQIAKGIVQLQQDHRLLAKSRAATTEQRQELEQRRQLAIVPVHAPTAGAVYFWVDGLEELASPANIAPTLWEELQAAKSVPVYETVDDTQVAAGRPVFKVAVDDKTYLLAQLEADKGELPPDWETVSICWQETVLTARIVEHEGLAAGQVLLQAEGEAAMRLPRFVEINLHKEGEVYCSVPIQAVSSWDSQNVVFVLEGNQVKAQPVEVLQQLNKKTVIVVGLKPGMPIVANPEGLVDGQDVTDRLRK